MKIENTQYYTPKECNIINKAFKEKGLDIQIQSENTCNKTGLRGVSKLFLNSLWGKFGTREILTEYTYVRTREEFYKIAGNNTKTQLITFNQIHENLIEVQPSRNPEFTDAPDYVSPITAVFTTSNARVRLYKFMDMFHPSQSLYCDTDSFYFAYNPNNPNHINPKTAELPDKVELGDGLGQWEEEMDDCIKFVSTGAKTKAGICINPKNNFLNAKGLTIDFLNKDVTT